MITSEKKDKNIPKLKSNTAIIKPRQGFQNKTITRIQTPKQMSQNFKYYNIEIPNLHIYRRMIQQSETAHGPGTRTPLTLLP